MFSFESEPRAAAPRPPEPTRGILRQRAEFQVYREKRERMERRSAMRGLILLAIVALVGNIARAGLDLVFVHGWWRP